MQRTRRRRWQRLVLMEIKILRRLIRRAFPERQLFFRVHGEISHISLGPVRQITMVGLVLTALVWSGFASFHYLAFDWMLENSRIDAEDGWAAFLRTDTERANFMAQRDALRDDVGNLELTLAVLQVSQENVIARVTESTAGQIDEASAVIAMTGLNIEALLADAARAAGGASANPDNVEAPLGGMGGPWVPAAGDQVADPLRARVAELGTHMVVWERMRDILGALPLTAPVDHYRLTSSYGTRQDPVNGRRSVHRGMDMANARGTAVQVPSPGRVVFSGRNGYYGRMIEIDHGFGITTRYGHLHEILVSVGDEVGFREIIGTVGSSGRSTGPHLHYEVRVDGQSVDPVPFFNAGRYLARGEESVEMVEAAMTETAGGNSE